MKKTLDPREISATDGRSHPPSLRTLTARAVRDANLFGPGDTVLCACSGGPDSTALVHVLAMLRPRLRHRVVAHGIDHGLRPEAARELEIAANVAASIGVPFEVTKVEVGPGGNVQARAREARLAALGDAAARVGAIAVATGHTADDRAETFLLRLLRGAGPSGLAVLPPSAPFPHQPSLRLIRPLILARRADVEAHVRRHTLPFATDPSNRDARFLRARVRHELLPLLASLSPAIVEHLTFLADSLDDLTQERGTDAALRGWNRAQRLARRAAEREGRIVKIRLAGGQDWVSAFPPEAGVLMDAKHDPEGE